MISSHTRVFRVPAKDTQRQAQVLKPVQPIFLYLLLYQTRQARVRLALGYRDVLNVNHRGRGVGLPAVEGRPRRRVRGSLRASRLNPRRTLFVLVRDLKFPRAPLR